MEVILTRAVPNVGDRGAIVRVADGYARNYLLPAGWAIVATRGARKQAESMIRAEARREQERREKAVTRRDTFHERTVTVRARATAAGKLYGSVSAKDICEALRETYGLEIDPDWCRIEEPIRALGEFTVPFVVYDDITAEVTVNVKTVEGEEPVEEAAEPTREVTPRAPRPKPIITDSAEQD